MGSFFSMLYNYNVLGLRFQPTELELMEYLREHITRRGSVNPLVIPEVDLNAVDPQQIPYLCQAYFPGDKQQWYLFHSCPRLYVRTDNRRENRKTPQGHWKGTGKPTNVLDRQGNVVGTRKTLVFYIGKSGSSCKTDWILHEFRSDGPSSAPASPTNRNPDSATTWVVCSVSNKPPASASSPSPGPGSPCTPTSSGGYSDRSCSPDPGSVSRGTNSTLYASSPPAMNLPANFAENAGWPTSHSGGNSPVLPSPGANFPAAPDVGGVALPAGPALGVYGMALTPGSGRPSDGQEPRSGSPSSQLAARMDVSLSFDDWEPAAPVGGVPLPTTPQPSSGNSMADPSSLMFQPPLDDMPWDSDVLGIHPMTQLPSQSNSGIHHSLLHDVVNSYLDTGIWSPDHQQWRSGGSN